MNASLLKKFYLSIMISFLCVILYATEVKPIWVESPDSLYSNETYITSVGTGSSLRNAENTAYGNISRVFGTTVMLDARSSKRFDTLSNSINKTSSMSENVQVTAEHTIENISIAENWQDTETKQWYTLAILPKAQTSQIYLQKINDLNASIQLYLEIAEFEQDLLYKFSLIDMASIYAQECENLYGYYNIVSSLVSTSLYNYRLLQAQAKAIARNIFFSIETATENSITEFAIEETLANLGMRINNENPTYILKENLAYAGMDNGFGTYIIHYVINIELIDNFGTRLTVFTFDGKEGGVNETDALRILKNKFVENCNSLENENSLLAQFTSFLNECL